jgi:hypothetical protein
MLVSVPYQKFLDNSKPTFYGNDGKLSKSNIVSATNRNVKPEIGKTYLPPLNASINFSSLSPFVLSMHPNLQSISSSIIRENFSWHKITSDDSPAQVRIKNNILPPPNQYSCGSCWAVSTASSISDCFVVSGKTKTNPLLSASYILTCKDYWQGRCGGGNQSILADVIASKGIPTQHCIDYSWCAENKYCTDPITNPGVSAGNLIPSCGCYDKDVDHSMYFIESSPKNIVKPSGSDRNTGITKENFAMIVKKHIYANGPVLASYLVYNNFHTGEFTKCKDTGGVYLENATYKDENATFYSADDDNYPLKPDQYAGAHAVTIMGWGVIKNAKLSNTSKGDLPYWWVRNSWGSSWGEGGYFKMAMDPFNKTAQFDVQISVPVLVGDTMKNVTGGGFILPIAGNFGKTTPNTFKELSFSDVQQKPDKRMQSNAFYKDESIKPSNTIDSRISFLDSISKKTTYDVFAVIGILIILGLIVFFGNKLYYKR